MLAFFRKCEGFSRYIVTRTQPRTTDEAQHHDQFYDAEAEQIFSSRLYRQLLDLHARFLLEVTPQLATSRILSVGCGDGRREIAMAKWAGQIVGIDLSRVAVEKARHQARELGIHNVEFHVNDANCLDIGFRSQFDAVWCAGILHHVSDGQIVALLRSSKLALKPGGRFVSMDPNAHRAVNIFKPLFRRAYTRYHTTGERELRPGDVAEKLESAGFQEIKVRFTDWFISPLSWLFPHLTGPITPLLVRLDQLLVKLPVVNELSSGFAAIAQNQE